MSRRRKARAFYVDTNVAIDYATNRDIQTVLLLERMKKRGWKCVSSTFLAMEMADYKQDYEFIAKQINKKRDPEDILRSRGQKNLSPADFQEIEEWFREFQQHFENLTLHDFMQDSNSWVLAKEISFNSNLAAPDVLHLASAILGALTGYCDTLMTKDGFLKKEAERILSGYKLGSRLRVMTPMEVMKKYFHT